MEEISDASTSSSRRSRWHHRHDRLNGPPVHDSSSARDGTLTGLVLGDVTQGVIIGSSLELMWLGVTGIGGYTPPDTISGAIVGTALGILSGQGATAGIAIAVPVAVVTQQLDVLAKTADIALVKRLTPRLSAVISARCGLYQYASLGIIVLFKVVPIFLAVLVGGEYVQSLFDMIPEVIMKGLNVAGGLLPAIGFGMLLNMMLKKKDVGLSARGLYCLCISRHVHYRHHVCRRGGRLPDAHDGQWVEFTENPAPATVSSSSDDDEVYDL